MAKLILFLLFSLESQSHESIRCLKVLSLDSNFYSKLPVSKEISERRQKIDLTIKMRRGRSTIESSYFQRDLFGSWEATAIVLNHYSHTERTFHLSYLKNKAEIQGERDGPTFVRFGVIPDLYLNLGSPTVVLMTLLQMKFLGIQASGLKQLVLETIVNEATNVELALHPEYTGAASRDIEGTQDFIARNFLNTKLGRYVKSLAELSGHKIIELEVLGIRYSTIDFISVDNLRVQVGEVKFNQIQGRLKTLNSIPSGYTIVFKLAPI